MALRLISRFAKVVSFLAKVLSIGAEYIPDYDDAQAAWQHATAPNAHDPNEILLDKLRDLPVYCLRMAKMEFIEGFNTAYWLNAWTASEDYFHGRDIHGRDI